MDITASAPARYELRFELRRDPLRAYVFPCDEQGQVDIDGLAERARIDYLFARAVMGIDVSRPSVRIARPG